MRTRILASVTLWLAAVVSVAAIAWLAIDAAGRQVTASPVAATLSTQTTAPFSPTTVPATTAAAGPTTVAPTTTKPARPSTPTPTRTSAPIVTAGPDSGPPAVTGSYATTGGRIRVSCRGHAITLDGGYAQPASGWSVRVQSGGPWQVQVVFELNNEQALLVVAICADGHPAFDQDRIEAGSPPTIQH